MCKHEMYVYHSFLTAVLVLTHCVELVTFIGAVGYVVASRRVRIAHRCYSTSTADIILEKLWTATMLRAKRVALTDIKPRTTVAVQR